MFWVKEVGSVSRRQYCTVWSKQGELHLKQSVICSNSLRERKHVPMK